MKARKRELAPVLAFVNPNVQPAIVLPGEDSSLPDKLQFVYLEMPEAISQFDALAEVHIARFMLKHPDCVRGDL